METRSTAKVLAKRMSKHYRMSLCEAAFIDATCVIKIRHDAMKVHDRSSLNYAQSQ